MCDEQCGSAEIQACLFLTAGAHLDRKLKKPPRRKVKWLQVISVAQNVPKGECVSTAVRRADSKARGDAGPNIDSSWP